MEASAATAFLGDSSNRPSPKGLKGRNGKMDIELIEHFEMVDAG